MKYIDEYRDPQAARALAAEMARTTTRPWTLMEVCGGQTHAIVRFGLDALLPRGVTLIHGPGCPVCVTPVELVDRAIQIASVPGIVFCSYGDMLRVPGTEGDLLSARAAGGDVRVVYSPLDALRIAQERPDLQVVFFGVGFETTAPATASAIARAHGLGISNFSVLVAHVRVPPALVAILQSPRCRTQGFLAAGHVCAVMGCEEYEPIASRFRVPIVVTGFEPLDLLDGIAACLAQLEQGRAEVENRYGRAVRPDGNRAARRVVEEVFEVGPRRWRGIGDIPDSGFRLRPGFASLDASNRFPAPPAEAPQTGPSECQSGPILQGWKRPDECPAFGRPCTPEHPLGATMVSSEGACAAYYRYRKTDTAAGLSRDVVPATSRPGPR